MNAERLYTVLVEPHFSEKVSAQGEVANHYGFKVSVDATKAEIKEAVEKLFGVTVDKVTTLNVKGKTKKTVRGITRKKNWKKAYVRVAAGQELDFMAAD